MRGMRDVEGGSDSRFSVGDFWCHGNYVPLMIAIREGFARVLRPKWLRLGNSAISFCTNLLACGENES